MELVLTAVGQKLEDYDRVGQVVAYFVADEVKPEQGAPVPRRALLERYYHDHAKHDLSKRLLGWLDYIYYGLHLRPDAKDHLKVGQ